MHYNIFYYSRLEPVENSEISTQCLQGTRSAAELNRHKWVINNPIKKKDILQTFILRNLQQTLLYYAHARLRISQLDLSFLNGSGNRYYHAESQYLETFTELQHYLIYKNSPQNNIIISNNDIRLLAPTLFLQFGYPLSSQSSYFESPRIVSFSRC